MLTFVSPHYPYQRRITPLLIEPTLLPSDLQIVYGFCKTSSSYCLFSVAGEIPAQQEDLTALTTCDWIFYPPRKALEANADFWERVGAGTAQVPAAETLSDYLQRLGKEVVLFP